MAKLSQAQLVRQAEIFITNGARPEAQAIIAGVGYGPTVLTSGGTMLTAVRAGQAQTKERLTAQKNATTAEKKARQNANKEITSLAETARLLFTAEGATLTLLGLQTQYETITDPDTGATAQQAVQARQATAATISRWRLLVTNVPQLTTTQRATLTAAGWSAARVTAAAALVETFASADTAQQSAIQGYQQSNAQYKADVEALRGWYGRARQLCGLAIKDNDPGNEQNLRELLGLNG